MDKKTYNFVFFLKALAAILIVNSHFDGLYPIPALATGGAIGNALFFTVSGFCLHPVNMPFRKWFFRRIVRLYVPTTLMTIVSIATYYPFTPSIAEIIHVFLWPTIFWFIGAMTVFYVLFFLLKRLETNRQYIVFFVVIAIIYIICYLRLDTSVWVIESKGLLSFEGGFKLIYYFAAMMIGKWFRIHSGNHFGRTTSYMLQTVTAFLTLYGGKYIITRNTVFMHFQFFNQVSIIWIVVAIFKLALSLEEKEPPHFLLILRKMVLFLSGLTLEIYLVQFLVIHYAENIVFPINVVLAAILIMVLARLLKGVSGRIIERVFNEKDRDRDFVLQ